MTSDKSWLLRGSHEKPDVCVRSHQILAWYRCVRVRGVFRGERLGAPPPLSDSGGGGVAPWIFRILRERALSLTTAIEKETKRKKIREKAEIYRFWSYDDQR